jgi:hypothetical protein
MFHFKLYDDSRLKDLKHTQKISIVNKAVKLYRKNHPVNLWTRLLLLFSVCVFPPVAIYITSEINLIIGWIALSIFILNIKLASDESPQVKPYLDKVLDVVVK